MATIDPSALAKELGIIFTKATTLATPDFDKDMGEVASDLWGQEEQFGALMIMDTPVSVLNVELELPGNKTTTVSLFSGILYPLRGVRIISAGTTATIITVFGGQ